MSRVRQVEIGAKAIHRPSVQGNINWTGEYSPHQPALSSGLGNGVPEQAATR